MKGLLMSCSFAIQDEYGMIFEDTVHCSTVRYTIYECFCSCALNSRSHQVQPVRYGDPGARQLTTSRQLIRSSSTGCRLNLSCLLSHQLAKNCRNLLSHLSNFRIAGNGVVFILNTPIYLSIAPSEDPVAEVMSYRGDGFK